MKKDIKLVVEGVECTYGDRRPGLFIRIPTTMPRDNRTYSSVRIKGESTLEYDCLLVGSQIERMGKNEKVQPLRMIHYELPKGSDGDKEKIENAIGNLRYAQGMLEAMGCCVKDIKAATPIANDYIEDVLSILLEIKNKEAERI